MSIKPPKTPREVATCYLCERKIVGVQKVRDAHCYGCGASVCLRCTRSIIIKHDQEMAYGPHVQEDHDRELAWIDREDGGKGA